MLIYQYSNTQTHKKAHTQESQQFLLSYLGIISEDSCYQRILKTKIIKSFFEKFII